MCTIVFDGKETHVAPRIMLPHYFSNRIVYVLKAIYGVFVNAFPLAAANLHSEVEQPREPERADLPPPLVLAYAL